MLLTFQKGKTIGCKTIKKAIFELGNIKLTWAKAMAEK